MTAGRHCVLHVGPPKTGTTAIQRTLDLNRGMLAARGIAYPAIGMRFFAHHTLAEAARSGTGFDAFADQIAALEGRLVLSSELIADANEASLRRLRGLFPAEGPRVVLYARSPLEVLSSYWSETVKAGRTWSLGECALDAALGNGPPLAMRPETFLPRLAAVFGRDAIEIHLYATALDTDGDVAAHFMRAILGVSEFARPAAHLNRSLAPVEAEVLRQLNRRPPADQKRPERVAAARALAKRIGDRTAPYLRTLTLWHDRPVFRGPERALLDTWRDRIVDPLPPGDVLFTERKRDVAFLDPAIWLDHDDLALALRALQAPG